MFLQLVSTCTLRGTTHPMEIQPAFWVHHAVIMVQFAWSSGTICLVLQLPWLSTSTCSKATEQPKSGQPRTTMVQYGIRHKSTSAQLLRSKLILWQLLTVDKFMICLFQRLVIESHSFKIYFCNRSSWKVFEVLLLNLMWPLTTFPLTTAHAQVMFWQHFVWCWKIRTQIIMWLEMKI